MVSRLVLCTLVAGMMITGCANTLLLKYQDTTCDTQSDTTSAGCASFPVLQSLMMFIGESLCFLVIALMKIYRYIRAPPDGRLSRLLVPTENSGDYSVLHSEDEGEDDGEDLLSASMTKEGLHPELVGFATLYLALPAISDICGTTIMSIGLLFVPASVFQMCRGSLVLFVGLFSVIFLRRRLATYQWASLFLITSGVFLVGLSSVLYSDDPANSPKIAPIGMETAAQSTLLGVLLITGAQLFTSTQFVLEEWILSKYSIEPLKVAGYEGVFGTIVTTIAMVLAFLFYGSTEKGQNGTFDVAAGLSTIISMGELKAAFLLFAVCIASFNFFGLSVTRTVSATSRSTIDTCRTLVIWIVSMSLGWETFKVLQLAGFVVLVYATLVFNGVIQPPRFIQSRTAADIDTTMVHTLE